MKWTGRALRGSFCNYCLNMFEWTNADLLVSFTIYHQWSGTNYTLSMFISVWCLKGLLSFLHFLHSKKTISAGKMLSIWLQFCSVFLVSCWHNIFNYLYVCVLIRRSHTKQPWTKTVLLNPHSFWFKNISDVLISYALLFRMFLVDMHLGSKNIVLFMYWFYLIFFVLMGKLKMLCHSTAVHKRFFLTIAFVLGGMR